MADPAWRVSHHPAPRASPRSWHAYRERPCPRFGKSSVEPGEATQGHWTGSCAREGHAVQGSLHRGAGVIGPFGVWADLFARTNDPTYLDRAFDAAIVFEDKGKYDEDPPDPLIAPPENPTRTRDNKLCYLGYNISTGDIIPLVGDIVVVYGELWDDKDGDGIYQSEHMPNHNLSPVGGLLQIYSALTIYNIERGVFYDPVKLGLLETACLQDLDVCVFFRNPQNYYLTQGAGQWPGADQRWQSHDGDFNDAWGLQSLAVVAARRALLDLEAVRQAHSQTLTANEQEMLDDMTNFWLIEGTQHFYSLWEQVSGRGEFVPADHPRGWPAFVEVINDGSIALDPTGPNRLDFERLICRTALYALKFQHGAQTGAAQGGIWASGGLGRFQFADLASARYSAMSNFVTALALAYDMPNVTTSEQGHIRAALWAILDSHRGHFKEQFGYWENAYKNPNPNPNAPNGEWESGFERRPIEAFLDVYDVLVKRHVTNGPVPLPPPTAEITSPLSRAQTAAVKYTFEVTVPGATTQTDLETALKNRTRIQRWEELSGYFQLSLELNTDPTDPMNMDLENFMYTPPSVTFQTKNLISLPGPNDEFKYAILTWDSIGRWDRDASYQEN